MTCEHHEVVLGLRPCLRCVLYTTRVHDSSSLNGAAWGIVAPNHILTFVTTSLSEYIFVLDVLEFYPPYFARALSESAIRIGIRVDLHRHFEAQRGCR